MIRLVGGLIVGAAIAVFLVAWDTGRVLDAYERSEWSTLPAVVIGVATAVATVAGTVWYRRRVHEIGGRARRFLGWVGLAWAALFVAGFFWTHVVRRDDDLGALEAAIVSYIVVIVVSALGALPILAVRGGGPRAHQPRDEVRVMHVGHKKPYFVALCDCGWAGTAHETDEPNAQDRAFRDARVHGTNVAPEVLQG
jgi:hypothetical protein